MNELKKLLEEKKADFIINNDELNQRVETRMVSYNNLLPVVNDNSVLHLRERKYYRSLQSLLIDSAARLNGDFSLDSTNSKMANGNFTVTYLKNNALQKKDAIAIKKEVKQKYEAELEVQKTQYIQELTQQQALEAQATAAAQAADNTKALQQELSALLAAK
jgi:hypothetical protein